MSRTFSTYFNTEDVDRLVGGAHRELETDFEQRREYLDERTVRAIESRLAFLRACWTLLLDRVP
jgi:hypothetical protein